MSKTVVGLFDDFTQAQRAVHDLENLGIAHDDISFVANNSNGQYDDPTRTPVVGDSTAAAAHSTGAGSTTGAVVGGGLGLTTGAVVGGGLGLTTGAVVGGGLGLTTGAVVGGGLGLLAGIGLLTIPGFGPIVAAGWLVSMISGAGIGAAAGGLLGGLVGAGVPHEKAHLYNEGVRRGGTLIAVKTADDMADRAAAVLSEHGAVDIDERAETYRQPANLSHPTFNAPTFTEPNLTSPTFSAPNFTAPPSTRAEMSNNLNPNMPPGFVAFEPSERQHAPRDADSGDYESDFRSNYNRTYMNSGLAYDKFAPAYRYGYGLSNDARFRAQDWTSVQSDVERDWESRRPGTWDRFSNAIRYAWEKSKSMERGDIRTGGFALDGSSDTRGIAEKVADTVTGDRIDDKTGKPFG